MRRFPPPPWTLEQIPGGYKVLDANGQSLAYVYGRETKADADIAKVLTSAASSLGKSRRKSSIRINLFSCLLIGLRFPTGGSLG
jgi:hypothetical protein